MDRWLLGLLAGLVGGAGGAVAVHFLLAQPEPATGASDPTVSARLERIERALLSNATGPTLEAKPEDTLGARLERIERLLAGGQLRSWTPDPAALSPMHPGLAEKLEARVADLESKVAEGKDAKPPEPKKKRVTLSEAARELDLTSSEEADLRRIYADAQEKYMKLLAGTDGDVETVRRDLEEAKKDPKKAPQMMAKYMPKVLLKIGEVLQVGMEQDAAVEATLGADRAARLERGFDVVEANPFGDSEMRIEANTR